VPGLERRGRVFFLLPASGLLRKCASSPSSFASADRSAAISALAVAISALAAARSRRVAASLSFVSRWSLASACWRNSVLACKQPVRRSICFSAVQTSSPRMSCAAVGKVDKPSRRTVAEIFMGDLLPW